MAAALAATGWLTWVLAMYVAAAGAQIGPPGRPEIPAQAAPDWLVELKPGVDWVDAVGAADGVALMVATRDACVRLLDGVSGAPRGDAVRVNPGVRPVTHGWAGNGAAYCFDRDAIHCLDVGTGELKWRHGELADGPDHAGDPEVLIRWVVAADSPAGVLAIRSDGRVVLLSHTEGVVVWRNDLGPLPVIRLHAQGDRAAVLWKSAGDVQVAFVDLARDEPRLSIRDVGDTWPIWSRLVGKELVLVLGQRTIVLEPQGQARTFEIRDVDASATIDIVQPAAESAPIRNNPPIVAQLVRAVGANLVLYDLRDGARRARPRCGVADLADPGCDSLRMQGTYVLTRSLRWARAQNLADGSCAGLDPPPGGAKLIDAHLSADCLLGIYRELGDGARSTWLAQSRLPGAYDAGSSHVNAYHRLQPAQPLRTLVWPPGYVVLVESERLLAYKLPACERDGGAGGT